MAELDPDQRRPCDACEPPSASWHRAPARPYYDGAGTRAELRRRGIAARIARRGIESSTRLGRHRWRVERSLSWPGCFRRLQARWDWDAGRWFAFVLVACAVVCFNRL
jgi:hypothetical protein